MNSKQLIKQLLPKSGPGHWLETFSTWAGVGFLGGLTAGCLDSWAGLTYAAYYTNAVNDAVGYNFWILLAAIGCLLLFLALPAVYLGRQFAGLLRIADPLRRFAYVFFLVAFDEGSLMIGILAANFMHASDRINLLASRSFLFSETGLWPILLLTLLNSVLWLLGEAIYNRDDQSCSGIVRQLLDLPLSYLAPGYLACAGIGLYLIVSQ